MSVLSTRLYLQIDPIYVGFLKFYRHSKFFTENNNKISKTISSYFIIAEDLDPLHETQIQVKLAKLSLIRGDYMQLGGIHKELNNTTNVLLTFIHKS